MELHDSGFFTDSPYGQSFLKDQHASNIIHLR